ncbi:MAG TPA: hypothetical protein VLZ12_04515 [Verrucomicrobiae bacterium]|nr:hypothetical protein [Verrucomicrobiae bacterium]
MDSQQAKEILNLYRPSVDDADPQFAEALAQVQRDPELRQWFDQHCALHAEIRDKIKAISVPAGLHERILARRKVVRPLVWWRSPIAIAAAAVVVIALSIYSIVSQLNPPARFSQFRQQVADFAAAGYTLDVQSASFDELRQQFASNGWPSDYTVPSGLAKLGVRGGCLMNWRGHKVSMLCLRGPDHHDAWLYVIKRAALSNAPKQSALQVAMVGRLMTASWSEGAKTYVLAAQGDEAFLRSLL